MSGQRSEEELSNRQKRWFEDKASEAQAAADNNDPKTLYRIVRELTGARSNSNVPIKSKDKVLLTNEDQMKRWTEHYHEVLNQPEPTMLFNFEQESNMASVDNIISYQYRTSLPRKLLKLSTHKRTISHLA